MRALSLKLLVLAALCLTGCMQHNGDIGYWFGTWHLESISVNGTDDPLYEGNFFFQFQTDKVRLSRISTTYPELLDECFGRWAQTDNTLTLDFSYTSASGSYWTPWAGTYLAKGVNVLNINTLTSKRLVLTLNDPDSDKTIVYTLRKQ